MEQKVAPLKATFPILPRRAKIALLGYLSTSFNTYIKYIKIFDMCIRSGIHTFFQHSIEITRLLVDKLDIAVVAKRLQDCVRYSYWPGI